MKIDSTQLLSNLQVLTDELIATVKYFKTLDFKYLQSKETPEKWSALECLEHLNLYGDFYLPEIEKRIFAAQQSNQNQIFKSGLLGDYSAKSMQIKNGNISKMNTFKEMNTNNSVLDIKCLERFLKQQERMKTLLAAAEKIDLNKVKTSISISKFIKFKIGDTFRFIIYHNQRHIIQAENAIKFAQKNS
jgi:hypothetical protein